MLSSPVFWRPVRRIPHHGVLAFALLACSLGAQAQDITVYSSGLVTQGQNRQLTAYVPLSPNTVTWSVNGITGGNSQVGTVSASGLYAAPSIIPTANTVTVRATSTAYATKSGTALLTITQVQPRLWSTSPTTVIPGSANLTLNGANFGNNLAVLVAGTPVSFTRLSATQLQLTMSTTTAQVGTTLPIQVQATGTGAIGSDIVRVSVVAGSTTTTGGASSGSGTSSGTGSTGGGTTPPPTDPGVGLGTANLRAARFLEQASFGPTPADINRVRQIGLDAWITEQMALPETPITNPGGQSNGVVQQQYLSRLTTAPDQLRQRVAHVLGQILVVSMNKNIYPDEIVPHLQTLSRGAFGNYRQLLGDVAMSAQMGKYLDLANSNRPMGSAAANENFARELLQLFSIGLVRLNPDGTEQRDAAGKPIPTYDQATIQQVALALTGWTYPGSGNNNWENFSGPLVPRDVNHDMRAKSFLGCNLNAGQGAQTDMNAVLDCVFQHPNTPPFIATRLIRGMVMSNPSPAYVGRVAAVFANNGSGQRGDLRAVVRAVLLDAEARNDTAGANSGRLKEPVLHVAGFVRALGGSIRSTNILPWEYSRMAQAPLTPPSVFGFYSPLFRLPSNPTVFAPEFQIYTPTEASLRANFFWRVLTNPGSDFTLDINPFVAVAGDTAALINRVDQTLLWGRMPSAMRQSLANAIAAQPDARQKALTALYLTLLSGLHTVQY